MDSLRSISFRHIIAVAIVLGMAGAPGRLNAADGPATNRAKQKTPDQKGKPIAGAFVSFVDGMLTLEYQNKKSVSRIKIPENAKTTVFNQDEGRFQPVDTAEAMKQLNAIVALESGGVATPRAETAETMMWRKAGTAVSVQINDENATIRIGEGKAPFAGNFLSFKDDFLFFLIKDRTGKLQKTYGDTVRFRMNETIAVYESVDGGEYKWIGTPRTAFPNVKEGSPVTIFHYYKTETDEFYLVLVGVKKK